MAVNYGHRPIFPAHMAEDNLISPMRIVNGCLVEGVPENNGEGFARSWYEGFDAPWLGSREIDECVDYRWDRDESSCSADSVSKDIADLLPSDPFGMDMSTTFTAITGWLEDLEADYGGCGTRNNVKVGNEDYSLFAGINFIWNNIVVSLNEGNMSNNSETRENQVVEGKFEGAECSCVRDDGAPHEALTFALSHHPCDRDDGAPHEALTFALSHLGVKDLLSVEMVCRSLQYTVRSDPLLWRRIHVEKPLNERITDDILLQLSGRAQGNLQCLSLLECPRITDDGLRRVLKCNPRLNKLCVPGCKRISIEGILSILRDFNKGSQGIRYLRIAGLYGVTHEHFEELQLLLGTEEHMKKKAHKPHFFARDQGSIYLLCDDECAIDVEVCPKCQELRLVYDCPFEGCHAKEGTSDSCRACMLCIARCIQCGRCTHDKEYEETFCLEHLCADCLTK